VLFWTAFWRDIESLGFSEEKSFLQDIPRITAWALMLGFVEFKG